MRIKALAKRLRGLAARVVETKADVAAWNEEALRIQEEGESMGLPEIVWHYLCDADIRLKDKLQGSNAYAERQEKSLHEALQVMEQGRLPSDEVES